MPPQCGATPPQFGGILPQNCLYFPVYFPYAVGVKKATYKGFFLRICRGIATKEDAEKYFNLYPADYKKMQNPNENMRL